MIPSEYPVLWQHIYDCYTDSFCVIAKKILWSIQAFCNLTNFFLLTFLLHKLLGVGVGDYVALNYKNFTDRIIIRGDIRLTYA